MAQWSGSILLSALAATVLVLDARPMQRAAHTLRPMLVRNGPSSARFPLHNPVPGLR